MFEHREPERHRRTASMALSPLSEQECEDLLAQVPLFCELSPRELRQLAAAGIQRDYPAGAVIIAQGENGVGFYVLIRGRVLVEQQLADGRGRELATLGRGQIFGEMALLDLWPRSARVVAQEESSALVLSIFEFRALLHENTTIASKLLSVLATRVRVAETASMS